MLKIPIIEAPNLTFGEKKKGGNEQISYVSSLGSNKKFPTNGTKKKEDAKRDAKLASLRETSQLRVYCDNKRGEGKGEGKLDCLMTRERR